ncbi:MAG: hypothetical protein LUQ45_03300 [Methanoregulaceae archaeon]|nr:hypothetical protein [Methanoregulaceae archaeon]
MGENQPSGLLHTLQSPYFLIGKGGNGIGACEGSSSSMQLAIECIAVVGRPDIRFRFGVFIAPGLRSRMLFSCSC